MSKFTLYIRYSWFHSYANYWHWRMFTYSLVLRGYALNARCVIFVPCSLYISLIPRPGYETSYICEAILVSYPDLGTRLAIYAKSPVAFAFSVVLSLQVHPRAIKLFNHDAAYMRKNTRLSPLAQLQCSHSGAEKPRISVWSTLDLIRLFRCPHSYNITKTLGHIWKT